MLRFAESLLDPTARPPEEPPTAGPAPGGSGDSTGTRAATTATDATAPAAWAAGGPGPGSLGLGSGSGLPRFYWHFIRQEKWLAIALFICGGMIDVLEAAVPAYFGRNVSLVSTHTPQTLLPDTWKQFAFMAAVLLLVRPTVFLSYAVLLNQIVIPGLTNMIRWCSNHWHVVRQSWTFFQNDFAGQRHLQPRHADRAGDAGKPGGWHSTPAGTSWCTAAARCCCYAPSTGG